MLRFPTKKLWFVGDNWYIASHHCPFKNHKIPYILICIHHLDRVNHDPCGSGLTRSALRKKNAQSLKSNVQPFQLVITNVELMKGILKSMVLVLFKKNNYITNKSVILRR